MLYYIRYESGTYSGGRCIDQKKKDDLSLRRQLDRATRFAAELSEGAIDDDAYSASPYINQSSSHRVKKRPVSMMSDPRDLSSSADDDSSQENHNGKKMRKKFRKRTSRSKSFLDSLRMAKRAKVSLENIHDISQHKKVFEVNHDGKIRLVEISQTINCNCTFAAKRDLCLHAVWVLINVLNVNENDDTLHQKVHDNKTLNNLFKQIKKDFSKTSASMPSTTMVITSPHVNQPSQQHVAQANQGAVQSSTHSLQYVAPVNQPFQQHIAQGNQGAVQSSTHSLQCVTPVNQPSQQHVAQGNQGAVQSSTLSLQCVTPVNQPSQQHVAQGNQGAVQSSTHSLPYVASEYQPSQKHVLQGNKQAVQSSTHALQYVAAGNQPSQHHITQGSKPPSLWSNHCVPAQTQQPVALGNQPSVQCNNPPTILSRQFVALTNQALPQPSSHGQQSSNFLTSRQPWHNSNPFTVVRISNRVKKCAGCPYALRDPFGPPFIGLVVQHKERDIYYDPNGFRRLSSEANHYYHCQWECLKARHPYISVAMIRVDPELLLDDLQKNSLETLLGVSL